MFCATIFNRENGIIIEGATLGPWKRLGVAALGCVAVVAWSGAICFIMFWGFKKANLLRIDEETELKGCDMVKHGELAYPVESWRETQYDVNTDRNVPMIMVQKPSTEFKEANGEAAALLKPVQT